MALAEVTVPDLRASIAAARGAGWAGTERLVADVDRYLRATRPTQVQVWRQQRFLAERPDCLPKRAENPWRG